MCLPIGPAASRSERWDAAFTRSLGRSVRKLLPPKARDGMINLRFLPSRQAGLLHGEAVRTPASLAVLLALVRMC